MKDVETKISKEEAFQRVKSIMDDLKNIKKNVEELFDNGYITTGYYEDLSDTLDDINEIFEEILEEIKKVNEGNLK